MSGLNILGHAIRKGEHGFNEAILDTLFNKLDFGRRPEIMVLPANIEDIKTALQYAKSYGLKVSICSGGHSWSANHVREGSLLINMSKFDKFEVDKAKMTATAGPGVGGSVLLNALVKQDLFFPAGHCKGVCIGGYLLQGGFGWNSRKLGMACESVLGLDIVTAAGEYVHASETENADLYWAARGSGGGFFGVVVRFHLRVYPKPKYAGNIMHVFKFKHLEEVMHWAYKAGPSISPAVEFQMLMCRKTLGYLGPGIEAAAPIFADTKSELEEAKAFMDDSPIKSKAFFEDPYMPTDIKLMYKFVMTHYPENHCWGVDNMWTSATLDELMPYIKGMVDNLPPPPAHILWLNWHPPMRRPDMAFSLEDKIYIALYGSWESPKDSPLYGNWAAGWMGKMAHLSTGIQLADEGLHQRTSPFVAQPHLEKLQAIRSLRDSDGRFHEWHSRPELG